MKNVIVITGASSGFGALAARALADAGHTVYASMRDLANRNAPQAAAARAYANEHGVDLRPIELDVASEPSANAAIERIVAEHGLHERADRCVVIDDEYESLRHSSYLPRTRHSSNRRRNQRAS